MLIAAFITLLPFANQESESYGTYDIGGKQIEARFPTSKIEGIAKAGALLSNGKIVATFEHEPSWVDFRKRFESAKAKQKPDAPTWNVRVTVFRRVEIQEIDSSGTMRIRSASISDKEYADIQGDLSRLCAAIEVMSEGNVRPKIHLDQEEHSQRLTAAESASKFVRKYLDPRINTGEFEAEDRAFRGPFASAIVVHPGLVTTRTNAIENHTPVADVSTTVTDGRTNGYGIYPLLKAAFLNTFGQRVASCLGIPISGNFGAAPNSWGTDLTWWVPNCAEFVPPSDWQVLTNATVPAHLSDQRAELLNKEVPVQPKSIATGAEVRGLPRISGISLSKYLSTPGSGATLARELSGDAVQVLQFGEHKLIFVSAQLAVGVAPSIAAHTGSKAIGWTDIDGTAYLVLEGGARLPTHQKDLINLPTTDVGELKKLANELSARFVTKEQLLIGSNAKLEKFSDPEKGDVLRATLGGLVNAGSVSIGRAPAGECLLLPGESSSVRISIKLLSSFPLSLVARAADGTVVDVAELHPGQTDLKGFSPEAIRRRGNLFYVAPEQWVTATVPIKASNIAITDIRLELAPIALAELDIRQVPNELLIESTTISRDLAADRPTLEFLTKSNPSLTRSRQFATNSPEVTPAALTAGLSDPMDVVRLNAAIAIANHKSPEIESALIPAVRGASGPVADAAALAMANQGSDAAWAALRKTVELGPFEYNRASAALALARKRDPKDAGRVSGLLASAAWRTRLAGAEALAQLPGPEAPRMLTVFLHELNPEVRLRVTQLADPTYEDVLRRVLWGSVNDTSDSVRLASYTKLLESTSGQFFSEGLKGLRDDSSIVRAKLVQTLGQRAEERLKAPLLSMLRDKSTEVRVEALIALARTPGSIEMSELAAVSTDPNPAIRHFLIELARKKGIQMPGLGNRR